MTEQLELEQQLKALIIRSCDIEDPPRDFSRDSLLIGPESPLGLDSLDAVEIVVAVQKTFGVRIGGADGSRKILQSIRTLTEFVVSAR